MIRTLSFQTAVTFAAVTLLLAGTAPAALAANECQIYYQYKTAGGATSSGNQYADAGQTKTLSVTNVLYIQNKKNNPVKVKITDLSPFNDTKWVTLNANAQDPPLGQYTGAVTLYSLTCETPEPSYSTAAQMIAALKDAGMAVEQIAAQVVGVFNTSAQQMASLLKSAGFDGPAVARALKSTFNAGGAQVAQWMKQASFSASSIAGALAGTFNAGAQQTAQWMKDAGYGINDVAAALRASLNNLSAEDVADALAAVFNASFDAVRQALEFAGFTASQVASWTVGQMVVENVIDGHTGGYHGIPITTPEQRFPLQPGSNTFTVRGIAVGATTGIAGLPAPATIAGRGGFNAGTVYRDYLHVTIDVSTRTPLGTSGTATLNVGGIAGPTFAWEVAEREGSGSRILLPGGSTRNAGRPDLAPLTFVNNLYRVGSATTTDNNGGIFTALEPFYNSAFCQGIPNGTVDRNNQQTSNRQDITVPDIRWGVENPSTVDVTTRFTIQLLRGREVVDSRQITSLGAGQRVEFFFSRPQSETCVARVGLGGGCFHCGLGREGWNDNAGYQVRVDTGLDVDEASESNNERAL